MTSETMTNPFDATRDPDRHHIWQRLVAADSDAFAAGAWHSIETDFDSEHFEGIRCHNSANPDYWEIAFPTLVSYRDSWLAAAQDFAKKRFVGLTNREAVYARTRLDRIDMAGDRALCHKKFSGDLKLLDGTTHSGSRQTLYRLHRCSTGWKIIGFLGFLPLEAGR